eukprot:532525-Rhodomonas_salina.1
MKSIGYKCGMKRAPVHSNRCPRHAYRGCVWPALVGSENLTNVMVVRMVLLLCVNDAHRRLRLFV